MSDANRRDDKNASARRLREAYSELLRHSGDDVAREGLRDTPARAAQAFEFLTRGYGQNLEELINGAVFASQTRDMVIVQNIELYSMCEHHLLPFIGKCHVAYIPDGKILGLSKVARVVDMYARRLQVQEELTRQIAGSISEAIGVSNVGVIIEAHHLCMMMRGVEKQNSLMKTSSMLGDFRSNSATRGEFLSLLSIND